MRMQDRFFIPPEPETDNTPAPEPENGLLHWIRSHPYAAISAITGLLIVSGAALVAQRSPLSSATTNGTWGGAGSLGLFFNSSQESGTNQDRTPGSILEKLAPKETFWFPTGGGTDTTTEMTTFESLLAQLIQPEKTNGIDSSSTPTLDIYSYIPRGLITINEPDKKRTPVQEALFEYGNTAGSYLRGFEDSHGNMLQILKDAREDRNNVEKAAAAAQIGTDYVRLGKDLEALELVPPSAKEIHLSFARAHIAVGEKLTAVAKTQSDESFLSAADEYNTTVEAYTGHYLALVTLFQTYDVQFSSSDPGSVFTFSSAPSF